MNVEKRDRDRLQHPFTDGDMRTHTGRYNRRM